MRYGGSSDFCPHWGTDTASSHVSACIGPHTDYQGFTILRQDPQQAGLEINVRGSWHSIPPSEGAFIVNIGDLFQVSHQCFGIQICQASRKITHGRRPRACVVCHSNGRMTDGAPHCIESHPPSLTRRRRGSLACPSSSSRALVTMPSSNASVRVLTRRTQGPTAIQCEQVTISK